MKRTKEHMTPLDQIRLRGDMLEQAVFSDDGFAGTFSAYPTVWVNHIEPSRSDGIYVEGDWELFSQHHYASIVRAWGAWKYRQGIHDSVGKWTDDAQSRLTLHLEILSYYVHCTSTIDNLKKCAEALDRDVLRHTPSRPLLSSTDWEELRRERNLDAHDGLRPLTNCDGEPLVDKDLIEQKKPVWGGDQSNLIPLRSWVDDIWTVFIKSTSSAWSEIMKRSPDPGPGKSGQGPEWDGPAPASGVAF
jgi:hypothetical protein